MNKAEERKLYEDWLHQSPEFADTIISAWDVWLGRAALAQPAAPDFCDTHCMWLDHAPGCPRHEAAPTVVEPDDMEGTAHTELGPPRPLVYATPPRAALTDEQIDDCLPLGMAPHSTLVGPDEIRKFARAIEAAHGIGGPK